MRGRHKTVAIGALIAMGVIAWIHDQVSPSESADKMVFWYRHRSFLDRWGDVSE